MWDLLSFFLGLFTGMLIITLIAWLAYANQVAIFAYCSATTPTCKSNNYYSDPGQSVTITNNPNLYVKDGILYYIRLVKDNNCIPDNYQIIPINYPQYCSFTLNGETVVGKQIQYGTGYYTITNSNNESIDINTGMNCTSLNNTFTGVPLPQWDASPLN